MIVWIVNAQIHEDTAMHDQKIVLKADHKFYGRWFNTRRCFR